MIKINKFLRNKPYQFVLAIILTISVLILNYYSTAKKNQEQNILDSLNNIYLNKSLDFLIDNLNPRYETIKLKITEGDTFEKILEKTKISSNEKKIIIKNLSKFKFVNNLYKGQNIYIKIDYLKPIRVTEITIELSKTKNLVFSRIVNLDKFEYKELEKNLNKVIVYKETSILNSLYSSAIKAGIPPNTIIEFARLYGFKIDFQRDSWKNDSFQVIYETYLDSKNKIVETGNILFANLNLQGKDFKLYIFKSKDRYEHFDQYGKSIKKSLMKTPINGARLSSSFGMRKHPILGYNKLHQGTDFAAPEGTPIMASGDGKVIRARWCGGGGNCIKIKHNSTYSTVYAHLKNFARGIKEGTRVRQGQIIGYVGSTGMSTGPHLHYEVIINGKKVNSQKLKLPSGKILKGKERKLFEISKIKLDVLKSKLINYQ